ncbi:MAG: hypothetical protein JSS72_09145 [Armatimonadetes bacterium]|nr:hypothetical protein [Armatimonadota bacterium]
MKKFNFRLQKVLEYRALEEEWAKQAWLEKQAERIAAEAELQRIRDRRTSLIASNPNTLDDRLALGRAVEKADDDDRAQQVVIAELIAEELSAHADYLRKQEDLKVLEKMKERKLEQWKLEQERKDQAALDEWSAQRKAA